MLPLSTMVGVAGTPRAAVGSVGTGLVGRKAYIGGVLTPRIIALGVAAALGLGLGLTGGLVLFQPRGVRSAPSLAPTPTILQRVQALSEYVTVKYVMEKVVMLEDIKWYGDNRVLLLAHGAVKAGMDLERLDREAVTVTGKKVNIHLPAPRITEVYLDEEHTKVVERWTGMWRRFDKDMEQDARARAVEELERAARYAGILEEARTNAQRQLHGLLTGLGYEVEFSE